jgi:hypothetical protein
MTFSPLAISCSNQQAILQLLVDVFIFSFERFQPLARSDS